LCLTVLSKIGDLFHLNSTEKILELRGNSKHFAEKGIFTGFYYFLSALKARELVAKKGRKSWGQSEQ
jgi:hypothetical protein